MSVLWLKWILIAALGWLVVACIAAAIFGLLINYGKRQEARTRWRQAGLGRGQKLPAKERIWMNELRPLPDIPAIAEGQDADDHR